MSLTVGASREARARRSLIVVLAAATFLFWASLYVYVPILPVYAESLGASLSMVGIVVASYAIAQLTLRIPIGVWADRLGRRKPFVVAGFVFAALGGLGLALAPNPWMLFAARAVTGIAAATWVATTVFFASNFPPRETARAMGIIAFINGAAQVAASLVGGFTAQAFGWQATFWLGMALALGAMPLLLFAPERRTSTPRPFSPHEFLKVSTVPVLLVISGLAALGQFVSQGVNIGFVPVYGAKIGATKAELGLILTVMFAAASLGSLAAAYLGERLGLARIQAAGFLLMAGGTLAVPFVHSVWLLGATQAVSGLGRGFFLPIQMAVSIQAVPQEQRATAMGVFQATYSIGMLLGPLLSGLLADRFGIASLFYVSAGIALLCAVASATPQVARLVARSTRAAASARG
ncbi:MAG: MFS transporter [Chloroflexota bacterium]|nr:MFS transporter [Chloroflexota bacterium]